MNPQPIKDYTKAKVSTTITELSEYVDALPTGFLELLTKAIPDPALQPMLIRGWYQLKAFMDHELPALYKMKTYKKWYRKDVLISGIDRDGKRVRIRMDKEGNLL